MNPEPFSPCPDATTEGIFGATMPTDSTTVFTIPAGERVSLTTRSIGVVHADRSIFLDRPLKVRATATEDYEVIDGTRRRKFIDVVPPVGDPNELWLAESNATPKHRV